MVSLINRNFMLQDQEWVIEEAGKEVDVEMKRPTDEMKSQTWNQKISNCHFHLAVMYALISLIPSLAPFSAGRQKL